MLVFLSVSPSLLFSSSPASLSSRSGEMMGLQEMSGVGAIRPAEEEGRLSR